MRKHKFSKELMRWFRISEVTSFPENILHILPEGKTWHGEERWKDGKSLPGMSVWFETDYQVWRLTLKMMTMIMMMQIWNHDLREHSKINFSPQPLLMWKFSNQFRQNLWWYRDRNTRSFLSHSFYLVCEKYCYKKTYKCKVGGNFQATAPVHFTKKKNLLSKLLYV
jgi:hypothetical protein